MGGGMVETPPCPPHPTRVSSCDLKFVQVVLLCSGTVGILATAANTGDVVRNLSTANTIIKTVFRYQLPTRGTVNGWLF